MFSLYMNGRFFQQREVKEEFWTEDPIALTKLLVTDVQWYEQHFRKTSKMLTMLLRHSNDQQLRNLRRNRIQGDIALIDFLQTDVMKRNFPKLCPASLWALALCMVKQCFTFSTIKGTSNLRGDANFLLELNRYLEDKRADPADSELVTIAFCTGHSFVITRETSEGESEDIDYVTMSSYAKYGSICHGTDLFNDQSILRNGLDVDYGVRAGLSARNMIHFPVERYVVPKGPAVVPVFVISDFPMTLPGLPSSIASSPATTLAPETPTSKAPIGRLPSTSTIGSEFISQAKGTNTRAGAD